MPYRLSGRPGRYVLKRLVLASIAIALVVGLFGGVVGCTTKTSDTGSSGATTQPASSASSAAEAARAKLLISVTDLAKDTKAYVILDTRDPKMYAAGHIPGAISAPWQTFATVGTGKPGDANWGVLMAPDKIAEAAGKLGIDTSKPIVLYSDPSGWGEDGRVVWTLQSIGLDNAKLLDGGYPAWVSAGEPTEKTAVTVPATTVTVGADKLADINATTEQMKQAVESSSAAIVDARSAKEYNGATDFGEARGGHVPGAINIPLSTLFNEDGTLKSNADLDKMFTDAGLKKDEPIIVYCTKGIRSAYMAEVMRMVGFEKAVNYDASFYSWAGDSALPVEK